MWLAILVTTLLVSTDAFFIGISLGATRGYRFRYLFLISAILFLFSAFSFCIATAAKGFIDLDFSVMVGVTFIVLGLTNLASKDDTSCGIAIKKIVLLGLVMSIDVVVATTSLTLKYSAIFIPCVLAASHFLFLMCGSVLTKYIHMPQKVRSIISAVCLITVGVLNLVGIF